MPQGPDSLVSRSRLRAQLRRLREERGFTQQQVADEMDWSLSKLIRIESGRNRISTNDLRVLMGFYRVDATRQGQLLALNKDVHQRQGLWDEYADVITREYAAYLSYEAVASIIRNFELTVVPGLLQTAEYAEQAMLGASMDPARIRRGVDLRIARQRLLFDKPEPPEMYFVIDESVLHRVVGGRDVMRRQLEHIKALAEKPNVKLLIVPYSAGLYPRHRRGYALFEFEDDENALVLFIEGAEGDMITSEATDRKPQDYLETFWALEELAGHTDVPKLLNDALKRLS